MQLVGWLVGGIVWLVRCEQQQQHQRNNHGNNSHRINGKHDGPEGARTCSLVLPVVWLPGLTDSVDGKVEPGGAAAVSLNF